MVRGEGGHRVTWWAASLLANAAILVTEYLHRSVPVGTSWLEILPRALPFYVLAQFFLFRSFSGAPHWFTASVVFSLGNAAMRILAVYGVAGHEVSSWARVLAGTAIMLSGAILLKGGLR